MSLIKGRIRLFCVSNVIASFACTGLLGPQYLSDLQGLGQNNGNEVIAADEIVPLSQLGEGDNNIIKSIEQIPSVMELAKTVKLNSKQSSNNTKTVTNKTSKTKTSKSTKKTVTTTVVTKKEVKASSNYTPASYSEVTGSAVVDYAKRYIGLKYVHAGRSLKTGTDCSGFTSLIYKEFGVSLPKTVSGQVTKGTYVKKSDLKKGDLVFYSSGTSYATHVGMYIGDGKVIHESNPRDGVKISSVNMMRYITARRVINSTAKKIAEQKVEEEKKTESNSINTDTSAAIVNDVNEIVQDNKQEVISNENLEVNDTTNEKASNSVSESDKGESEIIMDSKKEDSSEEKVVETPSPKEEQVEVKNDIKVEEAKEEIKEEIKVVEPKEEVKEEPVKEEITGESVEN